MRLWNPVLRRAVAPALAALMVVAMASTAAALCPRVTFVDMGYKQFSIGWTMGVDERDIPDFGGYRVWVREVWMDRWNLQKSYVWGVTDTAAAGYWSFEPFYIDSIRVYTSQDAINAFPYQYSVTAFARTVTDTAVANAAERLCRAENASDVLYPLQGVSDDLEMIRVIPNPYRSSADWEYGGQRRVVFIGLPATATIRIYTVAGALVRTLRHDNPESDQESWDLKNSDGDEVAAGLYLWDVDAGEIGDIEGKLMIMR
jgi:hypothetical protein